MLIFVLTILDFCNFKLNVHLYQPEVYSHVFKTKERDKKNCVLFYVISGDQDELRVKTSASTA